MDDEKLLDLPTTNTVAKAAALIAGGRSCSFNQMVEAAALIAVIEAAAFNRWW